MALLTTLADNSYQSLSTVQEAGNRSFLLAEFERLFGVVEPPQDFPSVAYDDNTGTFSDTSGGSYRVRYTY